MTEIPKLPGDSLTWMNSPWFFLWHHSLYAWYHALFTLGFSFRARGGHNMPLTGPALLLANHQSYLDPLIVGLVARRPLVYLARKTLFKNRIFAAMIRSLNAVPIDQDGIGKDGIRTILEQLHLGRAVIVFPEGERTPHGEMQPLKPGIQLLIKRTQAPIVPVGIAGAFDAWPRSRPAPMPAPLALPAGAGTIAVSMGEPIDGRHYADMPREQVLRELFDKIHAEQEHAEKLRRRW
jgi:1-acyl-sn-glycerol-3-phosphate acyltransferase